MSPSLRSFLAGGLLLSACAWPTAAASAQTVSSDAIARKAYNTTYNRFYALAGGALPDYHNLNSTLKASTFPELMAGAFSAGLGYGRGRGPFSVQAEWRIGVRSHESDMTAAYTQLISHTVSVAVRYNLLMGSQYALSVLGGLGYSSVSLSLQDPRQSYPASLASAVLATRADKRRLYQSIGLASIGLQVDRHFVWDRRADVQACGRARQLTAGLRLQYDLPIATGEWKTERAIFRTSHYMGADPQINPLGATASLIVGGLFSRY